MEEQHALLVLSQISAVISSLRASSYADEPSELEDPLVEDLKDLRRRAAAWHGRDWASVPPMDFLPPFLAVVRSPSTRGPPTDAALSALLRFVARGTLAAGRPPAEAGAAARAVVDAVAQCKFEGSTPAADECVLLRITQVLSAAARCPAAGHLLGDDQLINVFHACYRIGHYYHNSAGASELLTQASRQALSDLVAAVFARLPALEPVPEGQPGSALGTGGGAGGGGALLHPLQVSSPDLAAEGDGDGDGDDAASAPPPGESPPPAPAAAAATAAAAAAAAAATAAAAAGDGDGVQGAGQADAAAEQSGSPPAGRTPLPTSPREPEGGIVSLPPPVVVSVRPAAPPSEAGDGGGGGGGGAFAARLDEGYSADAVKEVLYFIISMVGAGDDAARPDLAAHGLDLANAALLAAGGPALERHAALLALLRADLPRAMFRAGAGGGAAALAGVSRLALTLYRTLGPSLLLQLEALVALLLLPAAEGRGGGAAGGAARLAALEGVVALVGQPGFARGAYAACDCRVDRSDLFEAACALLSKAAFPVGGPLAAPHLLALDGIRAVLAALAEPPEGEGEGGGGAGAAAAAPPAQADPAAAAAALRLLEELEAGDGDGGAAPASATGRPYVDIWGPLCAGEPLPLAAAAGGGPAGAARAARAEKALKRRLGAAADHFNRDARRGLAALQAARLLPPSALEPAPLARFLRACPGLSKAAVGEALGERGDFHDAVRAEFAGTFDFSGLEFDEALRAFMDAFRPPGEGQKIDRIVQAFGARFHAQRGAASGVASPDAAYVLAYSVIMLNTDLHNSQNRRKMTRRDFARINDATNDGRPMPAALLERCYSAIAASELKISEECAPEELPGQSAFWARLAADSARPRGRGPPPGARPGGALDADMARLAWGPTLAAASVVLDSATSERAARLAADALVAAARLAARHGLAEVPDAAVAALARFTAPALAAAAAAHPGAPRAAAAALGASPVALAALEAAFDIAGRHGDALRAPGWRAVAEAMVRLHALGLLPAEVLAADAGEDPAEARRRLPAPGGAGGAARRGGPSLFSRAINSLISIEAGDAGGADAAAAEAAAAAAADAAVARCRLPEVVADSKFLTAESLVELVRAVAWAGGDVAAAASGRGGAGAADAAAPELCLELLVALALRNRDRVGLVWPLVHDFLAACCTTGGADGGGAARGGRAGGADRGTPLAARALSGLMRVCGRLLPYRADAAPMLLGSLGLLASGLGPGAAWDLADRVAADLLGMLRAAAPHISAEADWRTVCALVRLAAAKPEAAPAAFEALGVACREERALGPGSFMPLLETCLQLVERYKRPAPEVAVKFLDMVEQMAGWLAAQGAALGAAAEAAAAGAPAPPRGAPPALTEAQLVELWLTTAGVLAKSLCRDGCRPLRDSAIGVLHRLVTQSAAARGVLPGALWVTASRELLVPVVADLARLAAARARSHPGADKSARLAVNMLCKALATHAPAMAGDPDFYDAWSAALAALGDCMAVRSEAVAESVPEDVKNLLLVLAAGGLLRPGWRDAAGRPLWDLTWSRAHHISSGLNPGLLAAHGVAVEGVAAGGAAGGVDGGEPALPAPPPPPAPAAAAAEPAAPAVAEPAAAAAAPFAPFAQPAAAAPPAPPAEGGPAPPASPKAAVPAAGAAAAVVATAAGVDGEGEAPAQENCRQS